MRRNRAIVASCFVHSVPLGLLAAAGCGPSSPQAATSVADGSPAVFGREGSPVDQTAGTSCAVDVALEPDTGRLEASARLLLSGRDARRELRFALHPDLWIDSATCGGASLAVRRGDDRDAASTQPESAPPSEGETPRFAPVDHVVDLTGVDSRADPIVIRYGGRLVQDVARGEAPGEIHNRQMRAHIGREGVYLSEQAAWHPVLTDAEAPDESDRRLRCHYELTVRPVAGMTFVASGDRAGPRDAEAGGGGPTIWKTRFPLDGLALVGGPHVVRERVVGEVTVETHLREEHAAHVDAILEAAASYLELYQPLLGPYPFRRFVVVENFFSSGFAFPGFTLLSQEVIAMGPAALRPGYLDHELLHNWWGNGVLVSPEDGDWCECLTSYCTNYMRSALEGRPDDARRYRRDACHAVSVLDAAADRPLGRFGRPDGPSRAVGYQKGAMVFHMLARRIGQDAMWRGLRRLYAERLGVPTTWDDVRAVLEDESGERLETFFDTWVRRPGAPELTIDDATYDAGSGRLLVTLAQRGDSFPVSVPLRLNYENGPRDEIAEIERPMEVAVFRSLVPPESVELDPDYDVLRVIAPSNRMPTVAGIVPPMRLTIVRSPGDREAYAAVAEAIRGRYNRVEGGEVRDVEASALTDRELSRGHVVLLGKVCYSPLAQWMLADGPVSFSERQFRIGEQLHDRPAEAVLCCVRNERDPGGVILLYYGNGDEALGRASLVPFYGGNSLVVFDAGRPVERRDFESVQRVTVRR